MDQDEVVVSRRLPEHLRDAAAVLFEEAFGSKMGIALPRPDTRPAFLARAFRADHVVVATQGETLLGMLGLSSGAGTYQGGPLDVPWDPRRNSDLLGTGGAVRAVLGLRVGDYRPAVGELYIAGVAVSPEARGGGIGTRLLDESVAIAHENRMRWLRLDVIESNARARALYERLGYKVTKVQSFKHLERVVGFGGMVSMELPIDYQAGAESS
jgi:ribosomal protein S18 acetylase RimI-like enzyme